MKISNPNLEVIPFSSLKAGDIFRFNGILYMKIPDIEEKHFNVYNLYKNNYDYIDYCPPVTPYPNATLNLT